MMENYLDFIKNKNTYKNNIKNISESFRSSDVSKALELITKLFKKNIEGKVAFDPMPIKTTSDNKECISYFWFSYKNDKLDMMWSFNFLVNNSSYETYSIDFYTGENAIDYWCNDNGTKTDVTIFTLNNSIAYFLPIVYHIVNNKDFDLSKKEAQDIAKKIFNNNVTESKFYIGAFKYNIYEGLNTTLLSDIYEATREVNDYRWQKKAERDDAYRRKVKTKSPADIHNWEILRDEYNDLLTAIRGGANTMEEVNFAMKKNVKTVMTIPAADKENEIEDHDSPELAFKKMSKYVSLVTKGIQPSLIICGAPGVGKTYNVKKQLKEAGYIENHNLITIKGKCTPRVLYTTLYDYRKPGEIVLIDDADGLVGPKAPEECINILKAALDSTSDEEGRLVSYGISGKLYDDDGDQLPKKFYYQGSVIIITNYQAGALDSALKGRSYIQDMVFTSEDILLRIKSLMPEIANDVAGMKAKIKAYDYLLELIDEEAEMDLSIRGFRLCATVYQAAEGDPEWTEDMIKSMIKEQMKYQASKLSKKAHY